MNETVNETCDLWGCGRSRNDSNVVVARLVGETTKTLVLCNYHMMMVRDGSDRWSVGETRP